MATGMPRIDHTGVTNVNRNANGQQPKAYVQELPRETEDGMRPEKQVGMLMCSQRSMRQSMC